MSKKSWTLIVGCTAFLLVGSIATLSGASTQTSTFRAVIASGIGGILGFLVDYVLSQVRRETLAGGPRVPRSPADDSSKAEQT